MGRHNIEFARALIRATRPSFLILTPVSLGLALAAVMAQGGQPPLLDVLLLLGAALLAHIAVNTLNEYQDFTSGLDLHTRRTPFSGGSGALPDFPAAAKAVLGLALVALAGVAGYGFWLVAQFGVDILPVGVLGLLLIATYTRWLNRHPFLCFAAPGLAFGPLMVMGADWVLSGDYHADTLLLSLIPLLLTNNLLLLNQYPDMEADARVGRRTFPLVYGLVASNRLYLTGCLIVALLMALLVMVGYWPLWTLLAELPLVLVWPVWRRIGDFARRGHVDALRPALAMNVVMVIAVPLLLGLVRALA